MRVGYGGRIVPDTTVRIWKVCRTGISNPVANVAAVVTPAHTSLQHTPHRRRNVEDVSPFFDLLFIVSRRGWPVNVGHSEDKMLTAFL